VTCLLGIALERRLFVVTAGALALAGHLLLGWRRTRVLLGALGLVLGDGRVLGGLPAPERRLPKASSWALLAWASAS
jgi:hypothetical protein